jgi:hypothetical protein
MSAVDRYNAIKRETALLREYLDKHLGFPNDELKASIALVDSFQDNWGLGMEQEWEPDILRWQAARAEFGIRIAALVRSLFVYVRAHIANSFRCQSKSSVKYINLDFLFRDPLISIQKVQKNTKQKLIAYVSASNSAPGTKDLRGNLLLGPKEMLQLGAPPTPESINGQSGNNLTIEELHSDDEDDNIFDISHRRGSTSSKRSFTTMNGRDENTPSNRHPHTRPFRPTTSQAGGSSHSVSDTEFTVVESQSDNIDQQASGSTGQNHTDVDPNAGQNHTEASGSAAVDPNVGQNLTEASGSAATPTQSEPSIKKSKDFIKLQDKLIKRRKRLIDSTNSPLLPEPKADFVARYSGLLKDLRDLPRNNAFHQVVRDAETLEEDRKTAEAEARVTNAARLTAILADDDDDEVR